MEMPYTGKVVWGIMAAVPVYRPSLRPATVQQRRAEFQGCVLAQIVFKPFMDSIAERVTIWKLSALRANSRGCKRGLLSKTLIPVCVVPLKSRLS